MLEGYGRSFLFSGSKIWTSGVEDDDFVVDWFVKIYKTELSKNPYIYFEVYDIVLSLKKKYSLKISELWQSFVKLKDFEKSYKHINT